MGVGFGRGGAESILAWVFWSSSTSSGSFGRVVRYSVASCEDYEASYPECPQIDYRAAFGECTFTPARPLCGTDGSLVVRRRFSCGDDDVLGPRLGRQWTTIPVEVESAFGFVFDATPATGVGLKLRRCGGGCPPVTEGPLEPSDTVRLAPFDAGVYVFEIEWPEGEEIDVDLEVFGDCG